MIFHTIDVYSFPKCETFLVIQNYMVGLRLPLYNQNFVIFINYLHFITKELPA